MGTPTAVERLRLAEELEEIGRLGDMNSRISAIQQRAGASLELADLATFDECIDTMLADPMLSRSQLGNWWQTARALLDGRFDEVEELAAGAFSKPEGASPNALNSYAGHLLALRREQGRLTELIPVIESAIEENPTLPAYRVALALALLESGDADQAGAILVEVAPDTFAVIPRDQTWPVGSSMLAEVIAAIGTAEHAAALYNELLAFRGTILALIGVLAVGAADRYLGILAMTAGMDHEVAETHFRDAVELEERIGSRPWLARTRYWYGRFLLDAGDVDAATPLLEDARHDASDLGMAGLVTAIDGLGR